ncbi:Carboxypeptidase SOL1 [Citrus sinensis]|nr:Carboxypeptidase SOL1 [Citrus sinensis]KAH9691887.1 Carboxypeptidase SOL1 [Citrus sinensis]
MTFLIQKDKEGCSTGHLFEGNPSETSFDKAKGHVTNAELEKAVKEFRQRCSNISRICCFIILAVLLPVWSAREFFLFSSKKVFPPVFEKFLYSNFGILDISMMTLQFIGNVHADEPVGRELLILLANWICNNHMKDPLVRLIAENMHLHIFPSMNPDGYALKRLGALVANYPWDGTQDKRSTVNLTFAHNMIFRVGHWVGSDWRYYYGCLDDEAFGFLASVYSCSHYYMSLSTEFQGGIMNGALVEISGDKWPSSDELPTIWEYNKMSMLNLVASLVKVNAGRAVADHYRLLTPGKRYEVMASMPGYKPKSTIIWLEETATADFIPRYHTRG